MAYVTVAKPIQFEMTIEKSRFISHIYPVPDEATARAILDKISKQYWDATHNCYAYIIGETGLIQKASDDGEPSGTAGVPILEVIKKNGLTDILIVVTRYFGGIKLGAGGLVRAYTRSASKGIQQAQLLRMEEHTFYEMTTDYATWNRVENQLKEVGLIHDKSYTEAVRVQFSIPDSQKNTFIQSIEQWGNRIKFKQTDNKLVPVRI